ncbi:MAG: phosphate acetyltransferase [Verrucomicrobiota bacterium]
MSLPVSAQEFIARQAERARALSPRRRIVFPEGDDPRVIEAATRLERDGLATPILIRQGDPQKHPKLKSYQSLYYERRRAKGLTEAEANVIAAKPLYFATLMVAAGDADGFVGGAANTTGETVRAALHCIGTRPNVRTVSSCFVMAVADRAFGHNGLFAFADCAIVVQPTSAQLADIAIATAESTRALIGAEPAVALLSFSTKGSGKHEDSEKIVEALKTLRARAPELNADGELQADAALMAAVGASKAPGSTVAGRANTLIFPDLDAGNIAYKLVERLAHGAAFGPFLQGLAKPANDLSRGCSADDIYSVAIVTALQS